MKYGIGVYDKEYIDSEPLPKVSPDLLPWLIKDRKEAEEGAYVNKGGKLFHDGTGLLRAQKTLNQAENALRDFVLVPNDPKSIEIYNFINLQIGVAKSKISLYSGKIYMLDKMIAALK